MKRISLIVTTVAIITVLVTSCSKDDVPFYGLSDAQKSFSNFKEGSYWIMRDFGSGRQDSFVVNSVTTSTFSASNNNEGEFLVEEKGILLNQYERNGRPTNVIWSLRFFGKGSGSQWLSYSTPTASVLPVSFTLNFNEMGMRINTKVYDNVTSTEDGNGSFDRTHVLLRLNDTIDRFNWQFDHSNIIR